VVSASELPGAAFEWSTELPGAAFEWSTGKGEYCVNIFIMNMLTSDTLCPLLHSKAAPGKGEGEGGIEGTPADAMMPGGLNLARPCRVPGGLNLPLPSARRIKPRSPLSSARRIKPRSALGARRISS